METCQTNKTAAEYEKVSTFSPAIGLAGKKFHFIGAGGVGMSGLAKLLLKNKALVSGSDQIESSIVDGLIERGADIKIGHEENNFPADSDAVVISAAIKEDNPELKVARQRGCKVYKYAEMLGELCNYYDGIAVSGTHGKSTASGWLVYLLKQAGVDTNFIVGAEISQLAASSGVGESNYFAAEACEYDRSFLNLHPRIGCILNIEADHLDYYKDEEQIVQAFCDFAAGLKPDGVLIVNGQDSNTAKVIDQLPDGLRYETFGLDENCTYSARNIYLVDGLYGFDVYHDDTLLGKTKISLPGEHNILNALAVTAMAVNAGVDIHKVLQLLGDFTGLDRRLMFKERIGQITIVDDYAHHPTEIKASLEAMRQRYRPGRIWCVFQPHQYSRTRFLLDDFAESFKLADVTVLPEIYFVRDTEASKKEVNSAMLVERIKNNGAMAVFIDGFEAICDYLNENVKPDDLVVTMGAGDIWKVADGYIQRLRENS